MPSIANSRPVVPEENNFWANQTIHGDIEASIIGMYYDTILTGVDRGYHVNIANSVGIPISNVLGNSFLMNDTNIWMRGDGSPRLKSISELQNIHDRNKDMSQPSPYTTFTSYPSTNQGGCKECVEFDVDLGRVQFDANAMYAAIQNGDGIVMLDPNAKDLETIPGSTWKMYGGKFGYINGILTRFLYDERLDDTGVAYWSGERTIPGFGASYGGMRYFESSDAAAAGTAYMNRRGTWFTPTSSARINSIPAGPISSWAGDNTSSFAESFCSGANFIGSGFHFTHSLDRSTIYMEPRMCTGSRIWNVPKAAKLYIVSDYTRAPDNIVDNTIRWQSDEFGLPSGATNFGDTPGLDCFDEDIGYYFSHEYIDKYNLYSSTIRLYSGSFGPLQNAIGYDISFDTSLEVMYTISSSRYFDAMTAMANAYWSAEEIGGYQPQNLKWSFNTSSVGHIDQDPQTGLAHAFQGPSGSYHNTWSMHMPFDEGTCRIPIPLFRSNWNIFTTHSNGTINTNQALTTNNLWDVNSEESWLEDAPSSAVSWKNRGEETYTKRPNCTCNPITEWFNRPLTATHRNTSSVQDEADNIINWVYTLTFSDGYVFSCGAFLRLLSFNPLQTNAGTQFQDSVINGSPNQPMPGSENWPKDITTRTVGRLYSNRTQFYNNVDYSNPNMGFIRCGDIVPGTTKTGGFLYLTNITRQNPNEYRYHYNVALDEYQFKLTGDTTTCVDGYRKSQLMPHGSIINTDWPRNEYPTSIFSGCVMIENGLYVLFEGGTQFYTQEEYWVDDGTILEDTDLSDDSD